MRHIDTGEAKAAAQEEKERIENLDEQGLCLECEDNPQNPAVNGKVCIKCWNSHDQIGCCMTGCPNSTVGHFRQCGYCEAHLIDIIHDKYEQYLEFKLELDGEKKELDKQAKEVDINPDKVNSQIYNDSTPDQQDFIDKWHSYQYRLKELHEMKSNIKRAIDQVDEAVPEGYELFG